MRIVLGTDGSPTAGAAVRFVAAFPFPPGTDTILVAVLEDVLRSHETGRLPPRQRDAVDDAGRTARDEAGAFLESAAALLRDSGHTVTTEIHRGHAADEIVTAADRHGADLIAVGSHGRSGYRRFLLGSVSNQVFQFAERSVLVVREPGQEGAGDHPEPPAPADRPWRILVAFDESAPANKAVDLCASLALGERSAVRLLTVLPMVTMFRQDIRQELDELWQRQRESEKAALEGAAERLRERPAAVTTALVEAGDVSQAILAAGDEFDADLIVLGHKGAGAVQRFLTGSVAQRVTRHANRSVLAVR